MADPISECPFCRGQFRVPGDAAADRMLCPHCRQVVDLSRWSVGLAAKPATIQLPEKGSGNEVRTTSDADVVIKPPQSNATPIVAVAASSGAVPVSGLDPELEKLLPPKFLVPESLQRVAKSLGAAHVILPDAEGGFQAVDTSVRQIRFAGQSIAIVRIPQSRKRLRRTIRSVIMFSVCVVILFVAFYLLNR